MKTRVIQDEPSERLPAGHTAEVTDGVGASRPGGGPNGPFGLAVVRRHPMVTFFVLAYAIAWSMWPLGDFVAIGPLIAALIVVVLTDGVAGLRHLGSRVIRWRVGWIWYVVAIAVPLTVHAAAIVLNMAAGAPAPSWSQLTPWTSLLLVLGTRMVNPLDGALGEEPGWRGYAQPGLQAKRSPLVATSILAVLVAGWHLPLIFIPRFDLSPVELVTTFFVTFWYAWLFNRTGGSVLLTLIAHNVEGSINYTGWWLPGAAVDRQLWTYLGVYALLATALVVFDRESWVRAPASAVDAPPEPSEQLIRAS